MTVPEPPPLTVKTAFGVLPLMLPPLTVTVLVLPEMAMPELIAALGAIAPRPLLLASSRRLALPFETFELYPATQAERVSHLILKRLTEPGEEKPQAQH